MKKVFMFLFSFCFFFSNVSAKTISDLFQELHYLEEEENTSLAYSSVDLETLVKEGNDLAQQILDINSQIDQLDQEIKEMEEKILSYQKEIGNILKAYQLANHKNITLEYIIDSNTYRDYIYRRMATKQIAAYHQQIIAGYQEEKKQFLFHKNSLEKQKEKLEDTREKYQQLEFILKKNNVSSMDSIVTSLADDITSLKQEIKTYQSLGCGNDEELSLCLNIGNIHGLNYPLKSGCVSKEYDFFSHKGIDLACNKEGENVYASGRGVVGEVLFKTSCGGNIVFIYHNVEGKKYTSIYGHLLEVKVVPGQVVDDDSIIGLLGGESTAFINGGYDKCTNGAHLHYTISNDYHTYDFSVYTKDPRLFNQYPDLYKGFFQR